MSKQEVNRIEEDIYYSLDFGHDVFDNYMKYNGNYPRVAIGFVGNVPLDFVSKGFDLSEDSRSTELFGNDLKNAIVYLDDKFPFLYRHSLVHDELPKDSNYRLTGLDNVVFDLIIAKKGGDTTIPVKIIATYQRAISNGKRRITLIVDKAETINRIEQQTSNNGGEPLRKYRRSRKSRKAHKSKKSKKSGKKSRRNSRR